MNALEFFQTLPGANDFSPVPKGKISKIFKGGKECVEGPNNCSNCDCEGVDDCKSDCRTEC